MRAYPGRHGATSQNALGVAAVSHSKVACFFSIYISTDKFRVAPPWTAHVRRPPFAPTVRLITDALRCVPAQTLSLSWLLPWVTTRRCVAFISRLVPSARPPSVVCQEDNDCPPFARLVDPSEGRGRVSQYGVDTRRLLRLPRQSRHTKHVTGGNTFIPRPFTPSIRAPPKRGACALIHDLHIVSSPLSRCSYIPLH